MGSREVDVVIVGAGPAGMMLAAELALAGVTPVVLDRRPDATLIGSRAGGFHSRTIEVLDQRRIADRFLAEGTTAQAMMLGATVLNVSDFPTRHPYSLGIWQNTIERILAGWLDELSVRVRYGCEVTGLAQDESGVTVHVTSGAPERARYVVGCDGGRSVVRKAAGIAFPGWEPTRSNLIAEVQVTEEPPVGVRRDAAGAHGLQRLEDGRTVRVVISERELSTDPEPTLTALSDAITAVYGTDFGVHDATWISRFTDAARQASSYRSGRVLLAGDAAHIHYPAGGQGLSLGVQDAVNLGWKLGQVVTGVSPDSLLDTYHAERHPVGARAIHYTLAQGTLQRADDRMQAVIDIVSELAGMDEPRTTLAGRVSGLDIHYDLGDGHPLLGRRMPDLDLATPDGSVSAFELLHEARPVLLHLGDVDLPDITRWSGRVPQVDARFNGELELPVLGKVSVPAAVLVRPDGYVAWVSDGTGAGLVDALRFWFGAER